MDLAAPGLFSAAEFRRRAPVEGAFAAQSELGDHALNPELNALILSNKLRDAAVLVPVVDHPGGATVILTQRNANLRNHSGQVAFPGGRVDATDPTPEFTALRETQEEIGLDPHEIDVIARMPDYVTGTGYRIVPVLAVVRPGFDLVVNPDEVEAVFEVPLAFLMNPANHHRASRELGGRQRHFYEMPFEDRYIWGVTAGIIHSLYQRLYA